MTSIFDAGHAQLPYHLTTPLAGKSILVTGSTGVVGLNLLSILTSTVQESGLELSIFGLSKSGSLPNSFPRPEYVKMLRSDLTEFESLGELPTFDLIIHGATYGQPAKFVANPRETLTLNTSVTAGLIEKARENFLFISSSEVYSGLGESPFREEQIGTTNTNHPRAIYIESKRAGEAVTLALNGKIAQTNVARLSLAYGPGARRTDDRVLYQLVYRALTDERLALRGGGEALRNYIYATDAAIYLLAALLCGTGEAYNVGGVGDSISIRNLAILIADIAEVRFLDEPQMEQGGVPAGAPTDVRLDTSKVRKLVPPFKHVEFREGLEKVISYSRQLVNNELG